MKIGIVGLPNVGKSTLFNALTKSYSADAANFPFCTIEPNVGVVEVKDYRIDELSRISNTKKTVYANIKFVDIAGLVKGASKGEGLGNKFLAHIREVDAIVQVVRYFEDDDVVHVEGGVNPLRDIDIINAELIISDLEQIESKIPTLEKKFKAKDKEALEMLPILLKMKDILSRGQIAYDLKDELSDKELKILRQYNLLTFKPFIYAFNVSEASLNYANKIIEEFGTKLNKPVAVVSAKLEQEMIDLNDQDKKDYLDGLKDDESIIIPTLDDLIKLAFDTVGLMYYFTTGEKETRAWTLKKGSTAPQAAGVIHTDFERGFIKAEVVDYEKFVQAGGWSKSKEKGVMRLEGKDYIVKDGDVILFRFNV